MHEFRNGRISMLVATDIVARGIDIDDIRLVINYDVPNDSEDMYTVSDVQHAPITTDAPLLLSVKQNSPNSSR